MPPKGGKKGLSLEEKRTKLLEFFTKDHSFYNIKEVETQGGKHTGVHPMQIKEVLQSLVDDGLVNAEKCGVSIFYWCFEYDKQKKIKDLVEKKEKEMVSVRSELKVLEERIKREKSVRERGDGVTKMKEIDQLKKEKVVLQEKLQSSGFNITRVSIVKEELQKNIEIGESATDNIESLISFFKNQSGVERAVFSHELGIPEEFTDFPNIEQVFSKLT